jgi:hypothetical protein
MTVEDELPAIQPRSNRSWRFDHTVPLLVRPRKTMADIVAADRPLWRAPILFLLLVTVAHALLAGSINAAARAGGEVVLPPNFEFWTPEQQAQYQQAATATNNPTFNYVLPALGAVLGALLMWLVVSWLLHLVLTLLGGRGSSQGAINVVAWASLPFVLRAVVQIVAMLLTDSLVAGGGLSGFAAAGEGSFNVFLASVLSQIDLYFIWHVILVYLGARLSSRLPRGKTWLAVLLVFALVMAVRALPDVVLARFGDLTVIQPFL